MKKSKETKKEILERVKKGATMTKVIFPDSIGYYIQSKNTNDTAQLNPISAKSFLSQLSNKLKCEIVTPTFFRYTF